jgi:hypothetical protein
MLPLSVAVSVTLTGWVVAAAEAPNVAEFCPLPTSTVGGTVTFGLLLDSDTAVPASGADPLIVTVQDATPGPVTVDGVQLRLLTCNCCCWLLARLNCVVTLPFSDAVKVTLSVVVVAATVAVNVAELCPQGTATPAGTLTLALLLESKTVDPLDGAGSLMATVQLAVPGPTTVLGVQLNPVTCVCGCWTSSTFNSVVAVLPFKSAVTITLSAVGVAPADAVKYPEVCPFVTSTVPGTVNLGLLLKIETVVPAAGAGPLMVTVQLVVPGPITVEGEQLRPVTSNVCAGGEMFNCTAAVLPFNPAVRVAVSAVAVNAADAVNAIAFCPAGTSTVEGTVTPALLLTSDTVVPPADAGPLSVTAQLAFPGATTLAGLQITLVTSSCG